jgi:hypothetical protein
LNHSMKIIMLFVAIYKAEQNHSGLFFTIRFDFNC